MIDNVIEWVVFDLGDVVLRSTAALPELADLLGADAGRLPGSYYAHRRDYDLVADPLAFWTSSARDAGAPAPDPDLIAELVRVDDLGWSVTDPDTMALIDDLVAGGTRLAVLSNAPSSMGRLIESLPWSKHFEHLLFSGDLTLAKPDQRIYRQLLDRLAADPAGVAFLDDRAENVAGAIQAGISAHQFTGAAKARLDLRALGLAV